MKELFEFWPVNTCAPRIGTDVLCKFKNGNYMVCRYDNRNGRPVFAIPPGWFAADNAYWPVDNVESFASLPFSMNREPDHESDTKQAPHKRELRQHCPDCGVGIGEEHKQNCDIERCPACGFQLLSCDCGEEELDGLAWIPWTGEFPGCAECREYGFWAKLIPGKGWTPCDKDDSEAKEHLNKLYAEGVWNKQLQRFVIE